jgi:hypothetical protein
MAETTRPKTSLSTATDDVLTPPNSTKPRYAMPIPQLSGTNAQSQSQPQPQFQTRSATAVRRPSPAPRNSRNELICVHDECKEKNVIFRRLCEWNKHMDRHERPYKCSHPNCQNALGFTYSGGLMRHQREVHRWHQTTKSRLFCPYPSCSRGPGGDGFSRRENLEEHKRRRHPDSHTTRADADADAEANEGSIDDQHQNKKRKRFSTPLPSDDSPRPDNSSVDNETSAHDDASEDAGDDEGPVVEKLRQELDAAQHAIRRLTQENEHLHRQVSQYYAFFSQSQPQVFPVAQTQGYVPQQMGYNTAYGGMPPAYKK